MPITVLNPYFVLRQRGVIQPRVAEIDDVRPVGDRWVASFNVRNREAVPLRLTSRRIQFVTDAADDGRAAARGARADRGSCQRARASR